HHALHHRVRHHLAHDHNDHPAAHDRDAHHPAHHHGAHHSARHHDDHHPARHHDDHHTARHHDDDHGLHDDDHDTAAARGFRPGDGILDRAGLGGRRHAHPPGGAGGSPGLVGVPVQRPRAGPGIGQRERHLDAGARIADLPGRHG